ncbi:tetratricopeptide repeat protein [Dactylosporangium sp. NPDC051485]|uniref:tetratricopeptide repeat protein n=1 Tax=Dactylosporangium sp. NPDC051485 TaxID=3154846 RepID=UPI00341ABFA7
MMMDRRHATGSGVPATQPSGWSAAGRGAAGAARACAVEPLETLLAEARDHLAGWRFQAARQVLAAAYSGLGRTDHTDDLAAQIAVLYAEVLRDTNRLADAQTLAEPLVDDLTARYGLRHPATVQALAVLGAVYHDLDRLADADDCYHLVLLSGAAPNGPAGRAARRTAANQALLRHDRGDTAGAIHDLTTAHDVLQRVQGAANPDTLHVAADLARLLHQAGQTRDARHLLTTSITAARAGLSDDHPLVGRLNADLLTLTGSTGGGAHQIGCAGDGAGRHRETRPGGRATTGAAARPATPAAAPYLLLTAPLAGAAIGCAVAALLGVLGILGVLGVSAVPRASGTEARR